MEAESSVRGVFGINQVIVVVGSIFRVVNNTATRGTTERYLARLANWNESYSNEVEVGIVYLRNSVAFLIAIGI